jgi:hypothetical protein
MDFYRPCAAHPAASQEAAFIISGDKSDKNPYMQRDKHQTYVLEILLILLQTTLRPAAR